MKLSLKMGLATYRGERRRVSVSLHEQFRADVRQRLSWLQGAPDPAAIAEDIRTTAAGLAEGAKTA